MEDKLEEVVLAYDFNVHKMTRIRGSFLLETDKGIKLLAKTYASAGRLVWENKVKNYLRANGFGMIDAYCINKEGNISSPDAMGVRYSVRDWYIGEECNLKDIEHVRKASANLAAFHEITKDFRPDTASPGLVQEDICPIFARHNKEMNHIRNYLKNKKYRNEFENKLYNAYPLFYDKAKETVKMLEDMSFGKRKIIHGSYTYHNIIMCDEGIATTAFDKCTYGFLIMDIYYFLRKVMEKNSWNEAFGAAVFEGYESIRKFDENELALIKCLLSYPEKFWKLASCYMNSKKTWIPRKNTEKLDSLIENNEDRNKFIEKIGS